jgi:predicted dehydrogenase
MRDLPCEGGFVREIRVGFIGAGDIATIHKAALLRIPGVKIAALYDVNSAKCGRVAADVDAKICESAKELVDSVDVVYVLTPQRYHHEGAVLALSAGKHTFIEKPVSLSRTEIAEMIELSEKHSCLCVPGHNYIHTHDLKLAKELIDSGKLGEIRGLWIFFMVSLPPEIRNRIPGPLREVMIHQFYSTLFLVGKPKSVFATTSDFSLRGLHNEDQTIVVGRLPGGGLVTLFASFAAEDLTGDPWTLKYKIVGTLGSASHSWSLSRLSDRPQPVWDLPAYWETFREEDRYFIEECIRGGKRPLSCMRDASTCLEILAAAEKSITNGFAEPLL